MPGSKPKNKPMPETLARGTTRAYSYCLAHWYAFTESDENTRYNNSELRRWILKFIAHFREQKKSAATLAQHLIALRIHFDSRVVYEWDVNQAFQKYRRELGRPAKKVRAIGLAEIEAMVSVVKSARNKALLAVGWSGALRSSELVAIRRQDLELTAEGFLLMVPRSKTDQLGRGKIVPLPYFHIARASICPVRNLESYLIYQSDLFGSTIDGESLVFPLTTRTVARVVARAAKLAGLSAGYSAHSLRRGLATTAAQHGIDERIIMRHGRWSTREVVDGYIDEGTLWTRTALDFLR